ncbi:MAG TPA: choline/ethanolamine kinase family protein [Candidatus Udaeobacter sp.]|nr:choline/ethanolamine kinase family protein [Candidatus Udaeobacter sp.]
MTEALSQFDGESADVRAALARIPELPGRGDWQIERLASLTNRSYRVARGDAAFVLRLPGPGTERYISRADEAFNAAAVASVGLAPELVFIEPATGVMLTRYVAGASPLSARSLEDPASLAATVRLLRRLHDSGLAFRGVMRLYPKLDEYLRLAEESGHAAAELRLSELKCLRRQVAPLEPILGPGWGPGKPCHIDPAPHNFIAAGGRHYLLDWEYAAMCEPLWDLAGLAIEGGLDADREARMLEIYFGQIEKAWLGRLYLYKIVLRLLAAAWAAVQIADGNSPLPAKALLNSFLLVVEEGLDAAEFGRHLAVA